MLILRFVRRMINKAMLRHDIRSIVGVRSHDGTKTINELQANVVWVVDSNARNRNCDDFHVYR